MKQKSFYAILKIKNIEKYIQTNYDSKDYNWMIELFNQKIKSLNNSIEIDSQIYQYLNGIKRNVYKEIHDSGIEKGMAVLSLLGKLEHDREERQGGLLEDMADQ